VCCSIHLSGYLASIDSRLLSEAFQLRCNVESKPALRFFHALDDATEDVMDLCAVMEHINDKTQALRLLQQQIARETQALVVQTRSVFVRCVPTRVV
jgi:hypothetical protein